MRVGDQVTYVLNDFAEVQRDGKIEIDENGEEKPTGTINIINLDVMQAVASRQKEYDQNIEVGSLYKIGSAQGVCVSRTPEDKLFKSMADSDPIVEGQTITAVFEITEAGQVELVADDAEEMETEAWQDSPRNATERAHIFKLASANVSIERRAKVVEFSFKTQMAISLSGMCNFRNIRFWRHQVPGEQRQRWALRSGVGPGPIWRAVL